MNKFLSARRALMILGALAFPAAAAATLAQVQALQDYGLPPVVYIQNPEKLTNDQAVVELYSLFPKKNDAAGILQEELSPKSPTKVGKALLALLDRAPEEKVRRITKMKLYALLKAVSDLVMRESDPRYQANPELLAAYAKRVEDVMAREDENDKDLAGLGKGGQSLRETLRERQAVLRKALELMAPGADFIKRLDGEMSTLQMDGSGEPLIPSTLMLLVKAIPEKDLSQRQWQTLFESYPMGKSLWESRVDKLWRAKLDGSGMTVAILDTGIDKAHPFLEGSVVDGIEGSNFTAHRYIDHDHRDASGQDLFGKPNYTGNHGTHVASTVLAYAPGARIINLKVLDEEAAGDIPPELAHDNMMTITSIKNGLQDVYEHNKALAAGRKSGSKIDMVSMSLGILGSAAALDSANPDELSAWVNRLTRQGVVVIVAAGNEGANNLRRPALAPEAITVGAVDYFDRITEFSSSISVLDPLQGTVDEKPDVWAYGHNVDAAKFDPNTKYSQSPPGSLSARMSGTSMATPHVAGMTLLLMQEARRNGVELSAAQVKGILKETASPIANGNAFARSKSGIIDANAAVAYLKERLAALKALVTNETPVKPGA
jgi:subtilisin family serine protease